MSNSLLPDELRNAIDRVPRFALAHLPTPLEPLRNLSRKLGGPTIWIKRDDCTGLAFGGNKTRHNEFLLGAALAEGADYFVWGAGVQSNNCRQTVAACVKARIPIHLVLSRAHLDGPVETQGNLLLDHLMGASTGSVAERCQAAEHRVHKNQPTVRIDGHVVNVQVTGRVPDSRQVRDVVASLSPGRNRRIFALWIRRLKRHDLSRSLVELPDLITRTQPDRRRIRRCPHPHAVPVRPLEDGDRVILLPPDKEQLPRLISRERQTDPLLSQPVHKVTRPLSIQPGLPGTGG